MFPNDVVERVCSPYVGEVFKGAGMLGLGLLMVFVGVNWFLVRFVYLRAYSAGWEDARDETLDEWDRARHQWEATHDPVL